MNNNNNYRRKDVVLRIASVLLIMMFALISAVPDFSYAAEEEPIREVHKVGVGNTQYCFFVTHNVILTSAEVAGMTDEELAAYILVKSGLYMKKTNCKSRENDKIISVKNWYEKNGAFYLSESDLKGIRAAEPADGNPVKFYMDLIVCENAGNKKKEETGKNEKDKESEETKAAEGSEEAEEPEEPEKSEDIPLYSTFKRNEPGLIFAVVATEKDAAIGEDICKGDQPKAADTEIPAGIPVISESVESESEMLPEYRTINMVDRSGKPVKATLEEGDPVKLEWIEQKNNKGNEDRGSFTDRVPGGITGLVIICAAASAAVIAAAVALKKKRADL